MHKYSEYMDAISGDHHKEEELKHLVCDELKKYEKYCPEEFWSMIYKIHCIAYGPHFDETTAKTAVGRMDNVDGTKGEHWSFEQARSLASQHGIEQVADLYYAINMLYSDLSKVIGGEVGTYAKMAKALYFDDPDMPKGKLFKQWVALMKE